MPQDNELAENAARWCESARRMECPRIRLTTTAESRRFGRVPEARARDFAEGPNADKHSAPGLQAGARLSLLAPWPYYFRRRAGVSPAWGRSAAADAPLSPEHAAASSRHVERRVRAVQQLKKKLKFKKKHLSHTRIYPNGVCGTLK